MQNTTIHNKIVPWEEHGRWYHGTFDFSTQSFIQTETDPELLTYEIETLSTGNVALIPDSTDITICDAKMIPRESLTTTANNSSLNLGHIRYRADEKTGMFFATTGITAGICDYYFFIVGGE